MSYFKRMKIVFLAALVATLIFLLSKLFSDLPQTIMIGIAALIFLWSIIYTIFNESIQTVKDVKKIYRDVKGKHHE